MGSCRVCAVTRSAMDTLARAFPSSAASGELGELMHGGSRPRPHRRYAPVIGFLAAAFKEAYDYVPLGSYGMKMNADGSTLYVNFNNPEFNHTSFVAVHIPESER